MVHSSRWGSTTSSSRSRSPHRRGTDLHPPDAHRVVAAHGNAGGTGGTGPGRRCADRRNPVEGALDRRSIAL
ncbi:hypothetical protein ASE38_09365 [Cellulomonas sp. Root930]|nr:hypothetical protein ASE38_09365 [Cellulomonas sp. Root930]